jgi:hypothetical protein
LFGGEIQGLGHSFPDPWSEGQAALEPTARVKARDFARGQLRHGASAVRGAIYPGIVNYDRMSISGQVDVHFDSVRPQGEGQSECGESVFGRDG